MAKDINIGGRLHSIATGNIIAGADEILDDEKEKKQSEINAETDIILAEHRSLINAVTNQNYVTVDSYNNLPSSGAVDTIYRVANWDGSLETPAVDITKYSEYAWNGTEYVFLSVKSQIGEVFDISAAHSGATYADLVTALGTNGANVPSTIRKGGMSVRFINTDGEYEQWRYMLSSVANADFANVANWQGVDDIPVLNSYNLVKSGGVYQADESIRVDMWNKYYRPFGTPLYSKSYYKIIDGQVVVQPHNNINIYLLPLIPSVSSIVTVITPRSISTPAFCYLESDNIDSYISGSEIYAEIPTTNDNVKAFIGTVPQIDNAGYILVNVYRSNVTRHIDYNLGYLLQDDILNRFNSVENNIQKIEEDVANNIKVKTNKYNTRILINTPGYLTVADDILQVTSNNNWVYGIIPLTNIKIIESMVWGTSFVACAFLTGNSVDDYIADSAIYNNRSDHKAIINFDEIRIPEAATHIAVTCQKNATDIYIYKALADTPFCYILDSSGHGDFSTIEETLLLAEKNSTVYVRDGEYSLLTVGGRRVDFIKGITWIGHERESVIFSYYDGVYGHAPIIHSGTFQNITFLSGYKEGVSPSVAPASTGYCVHLDFMEREEGVHFGARFENCHFKGYWNACIGFGARKDFVLEVVNCHVELLIDHNPVMDGVEHPNKRFRYCCVASHGVETTEDPDLIGSGIFKCHNNVMYSTKPAVVVLMDYVGGVYGDNVYPVYWEFIGNSCYSEVNHYNCVYSSTVNDYISSWTENERRELLPTSFGNTVSAMNKNTL